MQGPGPDAGKLFYVADALWADSEIWRIPMIDIKQHFTYSRLLRYTFSSIVMMVFSSIYCVVDGLFLSNYAGKTAFVAANFIYPFPMILGGVGFMFGSGGSALVAKTMGEAHMEKANRIFSNLVTLSVWTGVGLTIFGLIFLKPVAIAFGAEGPLLRDSLIYGGIIMLGIPAVVVQYEFQNLFVTADKPKLGLYSTVASGLTNIVLDALFVAVFSWGMAGAAIATVLSQYVGGVLPILYFGRANSSKLQIRRAKMDWKAMLRICTNGCSELLNNISISIVTIVYNMQLLKYAGDNGVAANGVLMYIDFVFISIFIGYVVGVSPIISFHYGAQNHREIGSLLRKSVVIMLVTSVVMFLLSEACARPVSMLFVSYDQELLDITLRGFLLYSFIFLFSGIAIFSSAFFTALNNGLISAILSFVRTIIFQISFVLILPVFWGMDGIWLSLVFAELLAVILGTILILANRKRYHY